MSGDEVPMVSREHMETQISMGRVETMLSMHREDFLDHSAKDERIFGELFTLSRKIEDDVLSIPEKMSKCRIELKGEVIEDMKENFVSKPEFDLFTTKIVYAIVGGVSVAGIIQWILSNYINASAIAGG